MNLRKMAVIILSMTLLSACSVRTAETKINEQKGTVVEAFVDKTKEEEQKKVEEEKAKQEAEAKLKVEQEQKLKAEQEAKAKLEAANKAKAEQEAKAGIPQSTKTMPNSTAVQQNPAAPVPNPTYPPAADSSKRPVEYLSSIENEILRLVNVERTKAGVKPLVMDETLKNMARFKSNDMLQYQYFEHTSPNFGGLKELADKFNYKYTALGENIWMSQSSSAVYLRQNTTAEKIMNGWMNSPGHKANILKTSFGKIGIGVTFSTDGFTHATQEFSN